MEPAANNQALKPFFLSDVPLGVKLIGLFNFVVTGLLSLALFVLIFTDPAKLTELIKNMGAEKMLDGKFTSEQLRMLILPQGGIAIFYIITAVGVLLRKEWARKALVYFSFFLAVFMVLGVILKPAVVVQVVGQAIHPGIMIYYFTGKKIVDWFALKPKQE